MLSTNHNILFKATVLALCVISFVHVFLFPLYDPNAGRPPTRTFADFEQSLCTTNIKHKVPKTPAKRAYCPQYGIVTIMQGGRLGNQMWEYASVWALARRTGLEPYIPRCIRAKLDQVFDALTVPTFEEIAHCPVELGKFVKSLDSWNYTNQSIILPRYSIQPDLVITWVQDVVQEFSIKRRLRDKSQQILHATARNCTSGCTFVGVHVRRTDYVGYLMRKHAADPANATFFRRAMRHFEAKYPDAVFVVVSDDPGWCKRKLARRKNVHVTGAARNRRNSPALDLAILAACNHSIFDYGTFGEWGAILAGGETVYYNLTRHSSERLGQLLGGWHTI